jgi:purine-nucleoside phosphorylase
MNTLARAIQDHRLPVPQLHVVLGSGLAGVFHEATPQDWSCVWSLDFSSTPELRVSTTVEGHHGRFELWHHRKSQLSLWVQVGRIHGYEGHSPNTVVKPVLLSRDAGTPTFLITNAAGCLNPKWKVGSVMMIQDHVNFTGKNPLEGPNPIHPETGQPRGPRFPDMVQAYTRELQAPLKKALLKNKARVVQGTYLGVSGPAYETPAEVRLFSKWGMGSVGMSTVWEVLALRHSGARIAGLSILSNMGSGLTNKRELKHADVEKEVSKVARKIVGAIFDFAVALPEVKT